MDDLTRGDPSRGVPPPHVAGLGGTLYTDHLLTVELAGAILFVAMVGAASIAIPRRAARAAAR
jgi:NADH-quinone oxidoreductase subunit J